jgi:hypothetical protein
MAHYKVEDTSLTTVADAIRERAGTTEGLAFPDGMASAVRGIPELAELLITNTLYEYRSNVSIKLRDSCFANCNVLEKVYLPLCPEVGGYSFQNCRVLTVTELPSVKKLNNYAFTGCRLLEKFDCSATNIYSKVFNECSVFKTLVLRTNSVCALGNINAFDSTPVKDGTGYIYVPRALVDSYKSATNWSTYSTQFRALEDYTVDGTTTGALDESKI